MDTHSPLPFPNMLPEEDLFLPLDADLAKRKKKIIVCCDGTACTAYKGDGESPPTNVIRIARCIKSVSREGIPQVVHYIPGIGTSAESDWNPFHMYYMGTGKGELPHLIPLLFFSFDD